MRRLATAAVLLLLVAAYVVMLVGTLGGHLGPVVIAGLALCVAEAVLVRRMASRVREILARSLAGSSWRVFVRQTLLVVTLVRIPAVTRGQAAALVVALIVQHVALSIFSGLRVVIRRRSLRRLETRNLDVPGADLPPPPRRLLSDGALALLSTDVLLFAAAAAVWRGGRYGVLVPAGITTAVLAAAAAALLVPSVIRLLRLPDDESRLLAAQKAVAELAPLAILYFSGGRTAVYQVNAWLRTMERLDRPVLVLLRERRYLADVAETTVPVLCLPFTVDVMNFPMPSARVGLFVANVGRNIHLLREPALMSAFIGHGDSDKTASFNPFTKVYDEVWVAGEAGRQRYIRAQVGVRPEQIVLVGRPQLDVIAEADGPTTRPGEQFTVLYAPTWEGWVDDPHATSLLELGVPMVAALLDVPGVRVVYKPHPLTGTVNRAVGEANAAIATMISTSGEPHESVLANERALYELFDESDALISDVSSVVSDYLRSNKPYFVCNPGGVADDDFRETNPSAGAAYLVGPVVDGVPAGLVDGLAAARGADPLRARRREVRTYLIGDPDQDAMELFRRAVDELARRADRQLVAVQQAAELEHVDIGVP